MLFSRIIRLAAGEIGDPPYKNFNAIFCLAFTVAVFIIIFGTAAGVQNIVRHKILGSMPEIIRLKPESVTLGPVKVSEEIDEETFNFIKGIPGVVQVYRQARLTRPSRLQADYMQQSFCSDIVTEAVDADFIKLLCRENSLEYGGEPGCEDCLLPAAVMDTVNAGLSIHTHLPAIDPQVLVNHHFSVFIGRSGFRNDGKKPFRLRCRIAGISPLIGIGGPAISYEKAQLYNLEPLICHGLILKLESPQHVPQVLEKASVKHLFSPDLKAAGQTGEIIKWFKIGSGFFCLLLTCCTGMSLYAGISLEVRQNLPQLVLYRVLGASLSDIIKIYCIRCLYIGLLGNVTGIAAGITAGDLLNRFCLSRSMITSAGPQPFLCPSALLLQAFLLGIAASVFFGLLPIIKTAASQKLNINFLN